MLATVSSRLDNTEVAPFQFSCCWSWRVEQRALITGEKRMREQFIEELLMPLPVHPVTAAIALCPEQIDGANHTRGARLPLAEIPQSAEITVPHLVPGIEAERHGRKGCSSEANGPDGSLLAEEIEHLLENSSFTRDSLRRIVC